MVNYKGMIEARTQTPLTLHTLNDVSYFVLLKQHATRSKDEQQNRNIAILRQAYAQQ